MRKLRPSDSSDQVDTAILNQNLPVDRSNDTYFKDERIQKTLRLTAISAVIAVASASAFAATAWTEGTTYSAGTVVTYKNLDYKALVTHTAYVGAGWTPDTTPTLWTLVGSGTATPTPAATTAPTATPAPTAAPTATPVATTAPTAAPTATPATGSCTAQAWTATNYNAGSLVSYNGRTYKAQWYASASDTPKQVANSWESPWLDQGACSGSGATPTAAPTATPVVTSAPTATPVATATTKPTATPVVTATAAPTATPVVTPTAAPTVTPVVTASPVPTSTPSTTPNTGAKQVGTYFAEWGIYGRGFYVKNMQTSGQAAKLTFINYSFANVYKQADGTYKCDASITRDESGNGDGGDAWASYQKGFDAASSVDGVADAWGADGVGSLKGNFGQLKKLKALNPNLKVLISIGGWSWSKYFSAASATDANRKALVASCIDQYIKGNLKYDSGSNAGGAGTLAGVFDGIDIDWEYPGVQGFGYNTVDPVNDKANHVALFKEFRDQLNALTAQTGKKYLFTTAIGVGQDKYDHTNPGAAYAYTDWVNIMSYDYHGAWDAKTDFQANLYKDPNSPNIATGGNNATFYTDHAINSLVSLGVPASKLQLGVPFYGRGWTGVAAGPNGDGLYQSASGAAKGTYENGFEDYKVLKNAAGTLRTHAITGDAWKYDGNNFWTYDTPAVIQNKAAYAKAKGLGGVFSWSADGDAGSELVNAMATVNQ